MTLTKPKPARKPANHHKRTGQHHNKSRHYLKSYWPYLPMVAILALSFMANGWLSRAHRGVLGYTTDVSIQNLLDGTNAQRSANGETGLSLNAQLDQAAQAKADDMATRDYWSHDTPDGQTPWTFIVAAGYSYQTAGENLAYGFDTSAGTITGWMNSPDHRANILNNAFQNVGFGIANAPNYQGGGPQTIIVAMYATPAVVPVATTAPISNNSSAASSAPAAPAESTPLVTTAPSATPAADTAVPTPAKAEQQTTEPAQKRVPRIQLIAANQGASWSLGALMILSTGALFVIVLRHGLAWRKVLLRGEQFALHHPLLDIAAVLVLATGIVLSQTAGLIR